MELILKTLAEKGEMTARQLAEETGLNYEGRHVSQFLPRLAKQGKVLYNEFRKTWKRA